MRWHAAEGLGRWEEFGVEVQQVRHFCVSQRERGERERAGNSGLDERVRLEEKEEVLRPRAHRNHAESSTTSSPTVTHFFFSFSFSPLLWLTRW